MKPEEFERLKAKEREHLEKMRELKDAVRQLEKQRSVVNALESMRSGAHDLLDEQARLVEDLARDTAYMEARAEMSTDEIMRDAELDEDTLRKIRAQQLIEAIKAEDDASKTQPSSAESAADSTEPPAPLPDKTIGRMRSAPSPDDTP
jgi:hypothetical protein